MTEDMLKMERNRIRIERQTYHDHVGVQSLINNYEAALNLIEKMQNGLTLARQRTEGGDWFSREEVSELLDMLG